ncbi:MAG: cbb3-type cytochrome oxidase assembly protein CcoS [Flavobacteriales bacterium]|nr:cbb3-type cytochrome oxidase assembly protein CcoS [Flavobacteriales bacterium]
MEVLFIMVVVSLCLALLFLGAFIWSFKDGQFDDSISPAIRVIMDDQPTLNNKTKKEHLEIDQDGK